MSVDVSRLQGTTRRVPNIRKFKKDKYHPNCYGEEKKSKEDKGDKVPQKGNNVVNLISHDIIRTLIIPSGDEKAKKSVFSTEEFHRLQDKSKFLTPKERTALIEKAKAEQVKKMTESAVRKKELQSYDTIRVQGGKLSEVEAEASRKANHLLTRAFELRQEQEDEIKKCNALILGTKCHAIRDAQMAEKKLIQKELLEEDKRLEEMMEQERKRALLEQEKLKEKEHTKKQIYVKGIMAQIKENELEKEIEMERIEEERRLANEAAMQIQLDELAAMKRKMEEQTKIRNDMNKVNQQLHYLASIEKEENRLADLKVQEFMRRKAEAEAAREREIEQQKHQREIELARLRAMQERAADTQAAKDEINAIRIQDEVEREWRKKEREAALKRAKDTEELKKAREQQVLDRRKCQAIESQKEKEEAEKIARVNQEALEREREEQHRKLCLMEKHRMELLKQIGEKEKSKIKSRQELFEEGLALKMEQQKREEMLKETMTKKMAMIRAHKVPEKYVREVERQLKIAEH